MSTVRMIPRIRDMSHCRASASARGDSSSCLPIRATFGTFTAASVVYGKVLRCAAFVTARIVGVLMSIGQNSALYHQCAHRLESADACFLIGKAPLSSTATHKRAISRPTGDRGEPRIQLTARSREVDVTQLSPRGSPWGFQLGLNPDECG